MRISNVLIVLLAHLHGRLVKAVISIWMISKKGVYENRQGGKRQGLFRPCVDHLDRHNYKRSVSYTVQCPGGPAR